MTSFNLLDEPWIPGTDASGRPIEVGLRQAILNAHGIAAIGHPSPLVTLALHRLLLCLVHRVVDGPQDGAQWRSLWTAARFDADAFQDYFADRHGCFDLFSPRHPFFQVADLTTVDKHRAPTAPSPASRLAIELASGNNATLFDHSREDKPPQLSAAEAVRQLLALQINAFGGGQGSTSNLFGKHPNLSNAPLVGTVSVLIQRANLFETLMVNLLPYAGDQPMQRTGDDRPVWEQTLHRPPGEVRPFGYLDWLTLPARYVRLLPSYDRDRLVVREAFITPGLVASRLEGAYDNPFAFHREVDKRGRFPVGLQPDRAMWRDSAALFDLGGGGSRDNRPANLRAAASSRLVRVLGANANLHLACFGLANDKAKPILWRREDMPATIRLLDEPDLVAELRDSLELAEAGGSALRSALRSLAYAVLETPDKSPDTKEVSRLAQRMETKAAYWSELEPHFQAYLLALGNDLGSRRDWLLAIRDVARAAFERALLASEGSLARRERAIVKARKSLHTHLSPLLSRLADLQQTQPANPNPQEVLA